MESSQHISSETIDLRLLWNRLFKALKRTWLLIVVLCVVLAAGNWLVAGARHTPQYRCQAIFTIGSGYDPNSIYSSNALYYDSNTAQALASAFPDLLKTDYMRDMIQFRLDGRPINGSISAAAIAETNLLEMQVVSSSAQDAYDIMNAVIESYPQAAKYMADNPVIQLLDEPVLPTAPYNSFSPSRAVSNGLMAGLALGLGITLLAALMNRTVVSAEELKKVTSLPVLASFPLISRKKRRSKQNNAFISAADNDAMAEALRGLRTKVHKQLADKNGKVVLLTSTIPGEGKTTISANLAISLAAEGHRVVLVDADLRNQTVARLFRSTQEENGLMHCLNHPEVSVLDCLKSLPGTKLFYLSGSSTAKRHYSIDGKALTHVLDTLCDHFDYIIMDTPPCSVVSDTTLLTRFADCVLYVIKLDYANQHQIMDAITGLHQRDVALGGCVLNGTTHSSRRYGYGYGYGYGYSSKYGSKYGKNRQSQ